MAKKLSKQPQKIIQRAQRQQQRQQIQAQTGPKHQLPTGKFVEGVGRRKTATSRVRIFASKKAQSEFIVNDQLANEYFSGIYNAVKIYTQPFELTGTLEKFVVSAKVEGSGIAAQLGAVIHGLSRALIKHDPAFRPLLKEAGLLTRDPRMKETRKPGRGGKARRQRQSPKR